MTWAESINRTVVKLERVGEGLLPAVAAKAHESIVVGSPLTGAPGQPVDTGALRNSYALGFPSTDTAEISSKLVYAPIIEDGVDPETGKPLTLRSQTGGFHSVKLTVAGFDKLVDAAVQELAGGAS